MKAINEIRNAVDANDSDFDWFGCTQEQHKSVGEELQINKDKEGDLYHNLIVCARITFVFSFLIRSLALATGNDNFKIEGKPLKVIFGYILISSGFLLVLDFSLNLFAKFVAVEFVQKYMTRHSVTIRYFTILFWLIVMKVYRRQIKDEKNLFYNIFSKTLRSLILIFIFLILSNIFLERFRRFFIKKSLKVKIQKIKQIESIIKELKKYIHDEEYSRTTSTSSFIDMNRYCIGVGCYDNKNNTEDNVLIHEPALPTLSSAMSLAKDVFIKASQESSELNFEQFAKIFKNPQFALKAFAYFDSDQDRTITKKEFRDTCVSFYNSRKELEKSYSAVVSFMTVIERIWYTIGGILISIPVLMFYGVHISKILTVLGSSAVILEIGAGKLLMVFPKSIIFLLNHQYDIGDEILYTDEIIRVHKIGILSTTFINKMGGSFKLFNSELWGNKLINMTRAPENNLLFSFDSDPNVTMKQIKELNEKIHNFLIKKIYDYHDNFSMQNQKIIKTGIDALHFIIILKCKGYKNMSKKFVLRIEFTEFLKKTLKEINIREV